MQRPGYPESRYSRTDDGNPFGHRSAPARPVIPTLPSPVTPSTGITGARLGGGRTKRAPPRTIWRSRRAGLGHAHHHRRQRHDPSSRVPSARAPSCRSGSGGPRHSPRAAGSGSGTASVCGYPRRCGECSIPGALRVCRPLGSGGVARSGSRTGEGAGRAAGRQDAAPDRRGHLRGGGGRGQMAPRRLDALAGAALDSQGAPSSTAAGAILCRVMCPTSDGNLERVVPRQASDDVPAQQRRSCEARCRPSQESAVRQSQQNAMRSCRRRHSAGVADKRGRAGS